MSAACKQENLREVLQQSKQENILAPASTNTVRSSIQKQRKNKIKNATFAP
jgi:hypothetical protein